MQYTTLGHTKLRVSTAGLGGGGFSRLGLKTGKTEDEAARLVLEAVDLGINFIDTAAAYGTEGVIGRAVTSLQRDQVVISTKSTVRRDGERVTPERLVASIDNSLRVMGIEHIDVFNLHGVMRDDYDYALKTLAPVLDARSGTSGLPRLRSLTIPMRCSNARCAIRSGKCSWWPST
jgi:aryl-alcohol dehydrogenase-like predicted oxidoreductase